MIRSFVVDAFLYVSSFFNWLSEKAKNGAIFVFCWGRGGKVKK